MTQGTHKFLLSKTKSDFGSPEQLNNSLKVFVVTCYPRGRMLRKINQTGVCLRLCHVNTDRVPVEPMLVHALYLGSTFKSSGCAVQLQVHAYSVITGTYV